MLLATWCVVGVGIGLFAVQQGFVGLGQRIVVSGLLGIITGIMGERGR